MALTPKQLLMPVGSPRIAPYRPASTPRGAPGPASVGDARYERNLLVRSLSYFSILLVFWPCMH